MLRTVCSGLTRYAAHRQKVIDLKHLQKTREKGEGPKGENHQQREKSVAK